MFGEHLMGARSTIEWTDATWNPVTGCTPVSEGCRHCYAERIVPRQGHAFKEVTLHPDRLSVPLHWKKPRRIFVNSLSDLFHEDIPDEFIGKVFLTMAAAGQHIFQILTKRAGRMSKLLANPPRSFPVVLCAGGLLPNVWLGVSCEDQKTADERIPLLLKTPAAVRFISAEPLIGPMDIEPYLGLADIDAVNPMLDWVIVGGESGPDARPMHPGWARALRDQCQLAGVPFFFKQWGQWRPMVRPSMDTSEDSHHFAFPDGTWMQRVHKKIAGRILDGRTWDEYPENTARG
jgi:protein gp37